MQLSLLQENLNNALSHVSRFVSSKSQLPILNNILFSTDNGRLKLSATNLDISINYWIGAKIEKEGAVTVPSRELTEFISYLSPGKLDINVNENSLFTVKSDKIESSFASSLPQDYPQIPTIDSVSAFKIDINLLLQSIDQIIFATASDDTRPVLTAVLCRFSSDNITLVATDGFRLSLKNIKLEHPINLKTDNQELTILIPAKTLNELNKIAKTETEITLGLTLDKNQLVFAGNDFEIVSRLIEGDYPNYQKIIPGSSSVTISLDKNEFLQNIKIASVFARSSANVVKLNLKKDHLEISANAPQVGQNKTTLDAKIVGDDLEIAFNYKFISDFLSVAKGNEIQIELTQSLAPGIFIDKSDPHFTHIIMPVRIQD